MPEPTTTTTIATATLSAAGITVPPLVFLGVNLGLRPDVLIAGFAGALVAIVLLGSVPSTGDTWRELMKTTGRRMAVALASSLTAGYITPITLLMANLPDPLLLGGAFAVGAGAQKALLRVIERVKASPNQPPSGGATP